MKKTISVMSILLAVFMLSCEKREQKPQSPQIQTQQSHLPQQQTIKADTPNPTPNTVVIKDVIQASSYTYIEAEEDGNNIWIAIAKTEDIKPGEKISFNKPLKMTNFTSKELNRTFDSIYFVGQISKGSSPAPGTMPAMTNHPKPAVEKVDIASITPAEGGITIEELFTNRDTHASKVVKIKGQVTKINLDIMAKNWVHLQDGTGSPGSNDLTITTQAKPSLGDVVTFEGTIILNKDFGSGYKYEVIMEQAKLLEN